MKHCVALATLVLVSAEAALSAVEPQPTQELRGAPWWRALQAETYYKQCHSSCTEFSQGTKTTVELCDDTQVRTLMLDNSKELHEVSMINAIPCYNSRQKHAFPS